MLVHHAMSFSAAILNSTPKESAAHTSHVLMLACCCSLASFSARVHSLAVMMKVLTDCAQDMALGQGPGKDLMYQYDLQTGQTPATSSSGAEEEGDAYLAQTAVHCAETVICLQ